MSTLNITNLTDYFVLKDNKYVLNKNVSYINLPNLITARFNISFEDIINFCFENYQKHDDRILTLFYSCMQDNLFKSIDITNLLWYSKFGYTLLENLFDKFEDAYIYFPLKSIDKKEINDIEIFLKVASLMLNTNTNSARHIVNSGLNKILLFNGDYSTSFQNKLLDLKLTCNFYL